MNLVFLFWKMAGHVDKRFEAENSNCVLFILGELSKDWKQFSNNVLLVELGGKLTKLLRTCASDHWGVFLAQLHKLLSQTFFLRSRSRIGVEKECAGWNTACEPFSLCKADDEGSENILNFCVSEGLWNANQGSWCLLSHYCFVALSELF